MCIKCHGAQAVFNIMEDLTSSIEIDDLRLRIGEPLLALFDADFFISYLWDEIDQRFFSGININMSLENIERYNNAIQFRDPITPVLQKRRQSSLVSDIIHDQDLLESEYYKNFLDIDGLRYGLMFFVFENDRNICDLRIWRRVDREDFNNCDKDLLNTIGASFSNVMIRLDREALERSSGRRLALNKEFYLTPREAEIADQVLIGDTDDEICHKLGISKSTLRTHITSIFRKTGVRRRSQLSQVLRPRDH